MYIIYVIDTETTGLQAADKKGLEIKDDVIEISMLRLKHENNKFHEEQKTWYLKAMNPSTISDDALRVNGHKKEDILCLTKYGKETYLEPSIVLPQIENWIMEDDVSVKDRIFAGQNPQFDINALEALWMKNNSKNTFPFDLEKGNRVLNTMQLALFVDVCLGQRRDFYNLSSLVKDFNITKRTAHKAEGDTKMTSDLLTAFINGMTESVKKNFSK